MRVEKKIIIKHECRYWKEGRWGQRRGLNKEEAALRVGFIGREFVIYVFVYYIQRGLKLVKRLGTYSIDGKQFVIERRLELRGDRGTDRA